MKDDNISNQQTAPTIEPTMIPAYCAAKLGLSGVGEETTSTDAVESNKDTVAEVLGHLHVATELVVRTKVSDPLEDVMEDSYTLNIEYRKTGG